VVRDLPLLTGCASTRQLAPVRGTPLLPLAMSATPNEDGPDHTPDDSQTEGELPTLTYTTHDIFQGRREVWIEHGGEMYRLRITSRGRLILTK
jgi:hemin uptake protein HemP